MKVALWAIGKTNEPYLETGTAIYTKRLAHYLRFEYEVWPGVKKQGKLTPEKLKEKEADLILAKLQTGDCLYLLDEKGKSYTSEHFARFLEQQLQQSHRRIVFLIGGAFGFAPSLYQRAAGQITLSSMTFSHQMVRLFFLEQLYRGMTIINNEKYHNS